MTRRIQYLSALVALALAACDVAPPDTAGAAPPLQPLHDHPATPPNGVITSIGEVQSVDLAANTITLSIVRGVVSERSGLGRIERFRASRQLVGEAQVGEVIEFKFRPGTPLSEIVAISRHHHGTPIGLPKEAEAR